jgi:alpha-galactosidase
MKEKKIVLIGAGSSSFMPAILRGLINSEDFRGATVGLVDIVPETLDLIEKTAWRIVKDNNLDLKIEASTDRRDVLPDADYVTVTISVGGDEAWRNDLEIPAKYGWIQSTGDTSGIGGLSRGLRHIPVAVEIAKDMEELCPDAWLFNFTNPLTPITRAVCRETSIKCMGLCIGVDITQNYLCSLINANKKDTTAWASGINHFHFMYGFQWRGQDAYPLVESRLKQAMGEDAADLAEKINAFPGLDLRPDQPIAGYQKFSADVFFQTGFFPGPGDSHVSEFLPHFFRSKEDYDKYGIKLYHIDSKAGGTISFIEHLRAIAEGREGVDSIPMFEEQMVFGVIHSLLHGDGGIIHLNLPNQGQIPNLPENAVVESPCNVDTFGVSPLVCDPIPEPIASLTRRWCEWQEILVDSALAGSRELTMKAMLADPGCRGIDTSSKMLDEILKANTRYLPRFSSMFKN